MIPQKIYPFVLRGSGTEQLYTIEHASDIIKLSTSYNQCPILTYGQTKRRYNMANFCTKCGAPLRPGAKFCLKCGNPVRSAGSTTAAPQNSGNTAPHAPASSGRQTAYPVQGSAVNRTGYPVNGQPVPVTQNVPPAKKKKKGGFLKTVSFLLVIVLLFTGFVSPGFFLNDRGGSGQNNPIFPGGSSGSSSASGADLKDTGKVSPNADDISLTISDCLMDHDVEYTVTPMNVKEDKNGGVKLYTYDISCAEITGSLNGYMELRIPYDDSYFDQGEDPADCLAVYCIDENGEAQPELFDVDTEYKEVVIYTEHLSKREVYHYRNAPAAEKYDANFGNTFVGNLSFKDCADLTTSFLNDLDEMDKAEQDYYYNEAAIRIIMAAGGAKMLRIFPENMNNYINDTTSWIGNAANIVAMGGEYSQSYMATGVNAISKLGLYTSMCKLSYAMSDLSSPWRVGCPAKEEVLNLYKTALTSGLDYASTYFSGGWIGAKFAMHMSVVFVLGLMIDSMFEEAMYLKMENMGAVYEYFGDTYTDGKYKPRTNKEWYDLFMDIFERYTKENKQDYIEDAVNREIYLYAQKFWELSPEEVANITYAAGYKRMPYPTPDEVDKLTDTYIENLTYRLHPIILQCERTMAKRAEAEAVRWLKETRERLNTKVKLELKDGNKKVQYAGYYYSFNNLSVNADKSIWQGQLDKDGKSSTKFSCNDWINAGVPTTVSLYETAKDMEEGKNAVAIGKFVPPANPSDISTVVFGEPSDDLVWVLDTIVYESYHRSEGYGVFEYSVTFEGETLRRTGSENGQSVENIATVKKIIPDARDGGLYREGSDNVYEIYTKDGAVGYAIVYRDKLSENHNVNKLIPEKKEGAFFAYRNEGWYIARYVCMPLSQAESYQTKHKDIDAMTYISEKMYLTSG